MRQSPLFSNIQTGEAIYDVEHATYKGICIKTFCLLLITTIVALFTGLYLPTIIAAGNFNAFYIMLIVASVIGFISAMVGRMSDRKAKYASVIYSACEGLFLGALTAICESMFPGVSVIAIFSTLIIFAVMLTLFATGILRVGDKFRKFCFAFGLGAIALILVTTISSFFLDYSTYLSVLIFVEFFLLVYGVITLSLNFQEAQMVVQLGASKNSEWSVALGLMISIVYIYVEILRLLVLLLANKD
ncbi:TPA: Bax inhibitor-1/YccA family protein [Candidatus Avacholeplasma faecigallinarum]|nr:Bax inhibitor-1/YccA family protein [Candidatus Avacholeplasma faecigallinarum]